MKKIYTETQGYRIRLARKAMGLTQLQLAKAAKTTQQTIHDYEKNKRGSYADTNLLINLSNICQVTLDWILKGKNIERSLLNIPILPTSKALLRWFKYSSRYRKVVGFSLEDDSMVANYPSNSSFNIKDTIIISLNKSLTINDYVVATTSSKQSPLVFRQFLLENDRYILKPLNRTYPTLTVSATVQIIAVAIEYHKLL